MYNIRAISTFWTLWFFSFCAKSGHARLLLLARRLENTANGLQLKFWSALLIIGFRRWTRLFRWRFYRWFSELLLHFLHSGTISGRGNPKWNRSLRLMLFSPIRSLLLLRGIHSSRITTLRNLIPSLTLTPPPIR